MDEIKRIGNAEIENGEKPKDQKQEKQEENRENGRHEQNQGQPERSVGGGGGSVRPSWQKTQAPDEGKPRWWPPCTHRRWSKLDKSRFKDRIVYLKECRACGKKKVEVISRDLNSRSVYTSRDVFAVEYKPENPHGAR